MKTNKKKTALIIAVAVVVIAEVVAVIAMTMGGGKQAETPAFDAYKVSSMSGYVSKYHPAHKSSGEAWALAEADGGAVILDVRSEDVYNERHVSGAINVPPEAVVDYAESHLPDKNRTIICYCFCGDNGGSAYTAYTQLAELGYTRVFYMDPEEEWTYKGSSVTDGDDSAHTTVTGVEAKALYDSGAILLDVRNQDEYDEMHIDGSILIPAAELDSRLSELPDKSAVIIVYCKSGKRSLTANDILLAAGFENVYDMQSVESWPGSLIER